MSQSILPIHDSTTPDVPVSTPELTDSNWLAQLEFRRSAPPELVSAAKRGAIDDVARILQTDGVGGKKLGKRHRRQILKQLEELWSECRSQTGEGGEARDRTGLSYCLFAADLEPEELSGRVETWMAATSNSPPDAETLVSALWLLRLCAHQLESQTLVSLWRWTLEGCRRERSNTDAATADQGCAAFDSVELHCAAGWTFDGLKGEHKVSKEAVKALQQALDSATDGDGTPHARWLDQILSRLSQLARLSLFASTFGINPWTEKSEKRIRRLLGRIAGLASNSGLLFSDVSLSALGHRLLSLAEIFEITLEPETRRLFKSWEKESPRSLTSEQERSIRKQLQKESHQSDWAEWGILRSGWSMPVDLCAIRHDGPVPILNVLAAETPLFGGEWGHRLTVNGEQVTNEEGWSCCCWYLDHQAAFMELQTKGEGPIQVIRQALLLRKDSVLIIGDSVRLSESGTIHFQRNLPLTSGWEIEEDAATRELALVKENKRVRVFPWTGAQYRVDRCHETTSLVDHNLQLNVQLETQAFYSATLFDWSEKRREEPVDWQRITVSEDGQFIPPHVASAHRLRLGKKQWVAYHSLVKPRIPRTALGIHTSSETVVAEFLAEGEIRTLVEVEL